MTILIFCSQIVFGQSKTIQKIVNIKNDKLNVVLQYQLDNDCKTGSGSLGITASGGSTPYTFRWTGPSGFNASTAEIKGLQSGLYNLVVTDATHCTYTNSYTIGTTCASVCQLKATASITNASACNLADGRISVTITAGSGSYRYQWYDKNYAPIGTSNKATALLPGNYALYVQDINNTACERYFFYTITSDFNATYTTTANTTCAPPYSGSIQCTVSGGSGNYGYEWVLPNGTKNTKAGATLSALPSGLYQVTIQDKTRGCSVQENFSIMTTGSLALSGMPAAATACSPYNGAVKVTVTKGSGKYRYNWVNDQNKTITNTKDLSTACPGQYTLYVNDTSSNCTASQSFLIPDQIVGQPSLIPLSENNSNCAAPYNGAISINSKGSNGPFSYILKGHNGFSSAQQNVTGLKPGEYSVCIRDEVSGCVDSAKITLEDISLPSIILDVNAIKDARSCSANDGAIETTVSTTNDAPYSIEWSGPNNFNASLKNIAGLIPGDYTVTAQVMCNRPPVITPPVVQLEGQKTLSLNLLDFIADADHNLDPATLAIITLPTSGAGASLNNTNLLLDYTGITFRGMDAVTISVCDVMKACAEKTITIQTDDHVVVYNAIAPHSSGDNKFMRIQNLPVKNKVAIFNRWGDKVFEIHDYDNDQRKFEGLGLHGKELPSGTYFYTIELAENKQPINGYLELKVD